MKKLTLLFITLATALLFFQNCIGTGETFAPLATGGIGEGTGYQGTLIPEGQYVRRYFYQACGRTLAEANSNGKEAALNLDNCTPVDFKIENYMVDHKVFNNYVFGLGPAIMRKLEPGQTAAAVAFDVLFCRYEIGLEAHDLMFYHEGDPNTLMVKRLIAKKDNPDSTWQLISDSDQDVINMLATPDGQSVQLFLADTLTSLTVETSPSASDPNIHLGIYSSSNIERQDVQCRVEGVAPIINSLPEPRDPMGSDSIPGQIDNRPRTVNDGQVGGI